MSTFVTSILGCRVSSPPTKYLGLLLEVLFKAKSIWDDRPSTFVKLPTEGLDRAPLGWMEDNVFAEGWEGYLN
jgi:hypothetical protein